MIKKPKKKNCCIQLIMVVVKNQSYGIIANVSALNAVNAVIVKISIIRYSIQLVNLLERLEIVMMAVVMNFSQLLINMLLNFPRQKWHKKRE